MQFRDDVKCFSFESVSSNNEMMDGFGSKPARVTTRASERVEDDDVRTGTVRAV